MVNHSKLVAVIAEIDKIKICFMSSSNSDIRPGSGRKNIAGKKQNRLFPLNSLFSDVNKIIHYPAKTSSTNYSSLIGNPEVLVQYSYVYKQLSYKGEKYVLITHFLKDIPYQLNFKQFGPDFPILMMPGQKIVGEENIENFLLHIQSDLVIQVDSENPHLSVLPENHSGNE